MEWLEPGNAEQHSWARGYLEARGYADHFEHRDKVLPNKPVSHTELIHAGDKIEQESGAREFFRDMKDAWRQKRSRDGAKGRRVCSFTLNETTKASLKEMAKDQGVSATDLLETLISRAYQAHLRRLKKRSEKTQVMLQEGRTNDIRRLHEIFCEDTAQPDTPAELDDPRDAEVSISEPDSPAVQAVADNVVEGADYDIDELDKDLTATQFDQDPPNDSRDNAPAANSLHEGQVPVLPAAQAPDEPMPPDDICSEPINSPNPAQAAPPIPVMGMPQKRKRAIPASLMERIQRAGQAATARFDTVDFAEELNEPNPEPSK
ncbi:hypothetical protein ACP0HU_00810 [Pseudomonas aeruginosa]|uniref:hypothetical protein n=1 Tax=Pseudomonadaceae TaxID=135621 RepID=UPI0022301E7A|nr:hypothetical protein [Stutzerimonas stutzeri]